MVRSPIGVGEGQVGNKIVGQKLLAGEHPVSKGQEEKRSPGEDGKGILVQLFVIHGRLTIAVVEHQLLNTVKDEK